jgi:hypothetical protein
MLPLARTTAAAVGTSLMTRPLNAATPDPDPPWDALPVCAIDITEPVVQHPFLEGDADTSEEAK